MVERKAPLSSGSNATVTILFEFVLNLILNVFVGSLRSGLRINATQSFFISPARHLEAHQAGREGYPSEWPGDRAPLETIANIQTRFQKFNDSANITTAKN